MSKRFGHSTRLFMYKVPYGTNDNISNAGGFCHIDFQFKRKD